MTGRDSHPGTAASAGRDRPFLPGAPGRLASRVYAGVVAGRNARFDAGRGVITLDRPVISVGNLSLGGTGKTPMVARIVSLLREHGHDPCVAMRGYGARRATDGRSDEAELYRARFEDLPIVAQPDRVEGLIRLFNTERGERVDAVVLDDGFQHRQIARQVDLVLVDASRDIFAGAVFPAGRLREPVASLGRATHITITHAELVSAAEIERLRARLGASAPKAALSTASHQWSGLDVTRIGLPEGTRPGHSARRVIVSVEPVSWLRGKRVVVACGIGHPESFLAGVARAGAAPAGTLLLPDHHTFGGRTVRRIVSTARARGADAIIVTEKDWTKLAGRVGVSWPCPVVRPRLEMGFGAGGDALDRDLLAVAASEPQ